MASKTIPIAGEEFLWLLGSTVRTLTKELGDEASRDSNGDALDDQELYLITPEGIFPVSDEE